MMEEKLFHKYVHIENSYQTEVVDYIKGFYGTAYPETQWVAQEKVHGTNFQFDLTPDGNGGCIVGAGKRSGALTDGEKFYQWESLIAQKQEVLYKLWEIAGEFAEIDLSQGLVVYGEYFGGGYGSQKALPGMSKIQKGVEYCPQHEFYCFDLWTPGQGYQSPLLTERICKEAGLFCAEALKTGTLDELLALDPVFPSTIAGRLGMPELETENMAEGYVFKPIKTRYFGNGERVILKHKNPKFQEIQKASRKVPKDPIERSEVYTKLLEGVQDYINQARAENCRSHLGEIHLPKDFGVLLKEFTVDVQTEFLGVQANREAYDSLEKAEQKAWNSEVNKGCVAVIRGTWMS